MKRKYYYRTKLIVNQIDKQYVLYINFKNKMIRVGSSNLRNNHHSLQKKSIPFSLNSSQAKNQ